uniref:Transmembrane protein n=1 Tax=Panagrellus redivivus TaxID=6233 RepID=A0A7E4ZSV0_PANRE
MEVAPAHAPPTRPEGTNSIVRHCIFAVGLVYATAAVMCKYVPGIHLPPNTFYYPAAYACIGSVLDSHGFYKMLSYANTLIRVYTYLLSAWYSLALVYYMIVGSDGSFDFEFRFAMLIVYVSWACISTWIRPALTLALYSTETTDDDS